MSKKTIVEAVRNGRILVSDGAWGTELQKRGFRFGECPEIWNLDQPDAVRDIARSYAKAGADLVETNSFGASRLKLDHFGRADDTARINEAAARLSREGAGPDRWVLGSVGPTGRMLLMEDTTEAELHDVFGEQAEALERGGADAICIETMSAVDEALCAVRAARERTSCDVICTFTFERTAKGDYRTLMGASPEEAAVAAVEAGAQVVGTNCGNGMERMVEILRLMRKATDGRIPLLVHANAGLPRPVEGGFVYPES
ncbi:MAG: homocysteine S-methyltransferase family protein, partial [Kiritimatiellia bacterium]|nr:homocysteine S-methyltransferase family protein [Kiritimatiellia bacterium]